MKFKGKDVKLTFTTDEGEHASVECSDFDLEDNGGDLVVLIPNAAAQLQALRPKCVKPGCQNERIPWRTNEAGTAMIGGAFCAEHLPRIDV